jgi:hypothetical protein
MSRLVYRFAFANMNIIYLLVLFLKNSLQFSVINQSVFLNPQTNSAFIQCPLNITARNLDIQWYDVTNQRYDDNRGRYYRIHGLQPFERELSCSSISKNEEFKFIIRIYSKSILLINFIYFYLI